MLSQLLNQRVVDTRISIPSNEKGKGMATLENNWQSFMRNFYFLLKTSTITEEPFPHQIHAGYDSTQIDVIHSVWISFPHFTLDLGKFIITAMQNIYTPAE